MLIKQSKNSFIRCTEKYGYITNQLTRHDRSYDENGSFWLRQISREPQEISHIIHKIYNEYDNVDIETLTTDFTEFINSLANDKFVIIGETIEDLDKNDISFTYAIDNPKTLSDNFYQQTKEYVNENTRDFFLEEIQGRPLISSLQFELSSKCNERCIHCYIPNEKKNHGFNMPTAKVKSILDEFAEMGGIHVTLSGGEAFMHNDLLDIVDYCRKKDFIISILSNLISLKEEHIPFLKRANVSLIQTSLYSMDSQIHDYITTIPGSWEKTKTSIEKLVENDIPIQISCPLMKANKDSYIDVLNYAHKLKVNAQTDYIMMARSNLDTDNLANRLSLDETSKVIRDIIKYDIDYRNDTLKQKPITDERDFDIEKYKNKPICSVGYDNCCITANGDVYPCAGWQGYILGNVYKQTLSGIWENSEKVKKLRKITEASFPECLMCEARQYCARCLVRNYNESNGNMFKINKHFCDVAFMNKKIVEEEIQKGLYEKN